MNTNRLTWLWIVALNMGLLLSACTSASPAAPSDTNQPEVIISEPTVTPSDAPQVDLSQEVKASKPWKLVFVSKEWNYGNTQKHAQYWLQAQAGFEQAATDFGVDIDIVVNEQPCERETTCVEEQIKLMAGVIEQGAYDAIILGTLDSNRLAPVVEKAISAGFPIITMDTTVNSDHILTFVSSNNFLTGQAIGEWVVDELGGAGRVLILEGPSNHTNAIKRRDGILAGLSTGNMQVLDTEPANWQQDEAKAITTDWLQEYSEINAIIAANDPMALGAVEAIEEANRTGIIVIGHDANQAALEAVATNRLNATIPQSPDLQARIAVQLMIRHLENGETFPADTFLPETPVITAKNVSQYLVEN